MTVADLIRKLQSLPMDAIVVHTSDNFELNDATVEYDGHMYECELMKESQQFRDAFDGGTYSKEVFTHVPIQSDNKRKIVDLAKSVKCIHL